MHSPRRSRLISQYEMTKLLCSPLSLEFLILGITMQATMDRSARIRGLGEFKHASGYFSHRTPESREQAFKTDQKYSLLALSSSSQPGKMSAPFNLHITSPVNVATPRQGTKQCGQCHQPGPSSNDASSDAGPCCSLSSLHARAHCYHMDAYENSLCELACDETLSRHYKRPRSLCMRSDILTPLQHHHSLDNRRSYHL